MDPNYDAPAHLHPVDGQYGDQQGFDVYHVEAVEPQKQSFWKKLGGGSLSISIIIHAAILLAGVIWVVGRIEPPPEKKVDFNPGGGGGTPAAAAPQQVQNINNSLAKVAAVGAASTFTLPEPEISDNMASLGSLSTSDALSGQLGGLGGSGGGSGGGNGTGDGLGNGSGMGSGSGLGDFLGSLDPNATGLVGSFYDLKQNENREPTNVDDEKAAQIVRDFVAGNWDESILANYYKADVNLFQSRIFIPQMAAQRAPAAFRCENEVEPKRWVLIYRGNIVPPESGTYRFVGAGDDILAVRFDNKMVFDWGYFAASANFRISGKNGELRGRKQDRDFIREVGRSKFPMKVPVDTYQYPSCQSYNSALGGLAVGAPFTVQEGRSYPIEILISELPGGNFGAVLLLDQQGAKYDKQGDNPILPLFRLNNDLPKVPERAVNAPPFSGSSAPWSVAPRGSGRLNI